MCYVLFIWSVQSIVGSVECAVCSLFCVLSSICCLLCIVQPLMFSQGCIKVSCGLKYNQSMTCLVTQPNTNIQNIKGLERMNKIVITTENTEKKLN